MKPGSGSRTRCLWARQRMLRSNGVSGLSQHRGHWGCGARGGKGCRRGQGSGDPVWEDGDGGERRQEQSRGGGEHMKAAGTDAREGSRRAWWGREDAVPMWDI